MKSTYCEYILEKILSTSEVGPILALIAPNPLGRWKNKNTNMEKMKIQRAHIVNRSRHYDNVS